MVLGLAAIYLSRRRGYHREWIMYRYLAERLRSAFFLALVTPLEPVAQSPDPTVLHQSGDEWLQRSVDAMWQSRPAIPPSLPVDGLRRFLVAAWVADQRAYQTRKSRGHELAHEQIARTGVLIFAVTLIVAATDALDLGRHGSLWATGAAVVLYLSIILPAVAGAISGIGALREHPRNAHRSDRMARYLARLETRIARTRCAGAAYAGASGRGDDGGRDRRLVRDHGIAGCRRHCIAEERGDAVSLTVWSYG